MLLAPGCLARRLLSPDSGSSNLAGSRLAVHSSGSLARRLLLLLPLPLLLLLLRLAVRSSGSLARRLLLLLPLRASSNLAGGGQGGW